MLKPPFFITILSVVVATIVPGIACAQEYPNKPIRILTSPSGGGSDFLARIIANELAGSMGQQVIVENRVANSGTEMVSKATPDGYTLLVQGNAVWILPFLQTVNYDPVKDFSPITWATRVPFVFVVHPAVTANSVKDLIALAKAKPGTLNYASSPPGGPIHLAAELFKSMAGVNIVAITYKGGGPALTGLLGGEAQMMFAAVSEGLPHVKSGKLKALAITSAQPSERLPGLATVAASGVPGYEANTMYSIFVPAKTPAAIIRRLNQESVRLLNKPEIKERLLNTGAEVVASTPEQLAVAFKADMGRMGKVIKDAGIRGE